MTTKSIDELTTPLTTTEVQTSIYDALAAKGAATTSWKAGAVVRTLIAAVAIIVAALSRLIAEVAKSAFLDLTSGDWLALVAKYVYGVDKLLATFATGTVTLDNTGGGVYSGDPGDLVVKNAVTGKTYRNTSAFSVAALETGVVVPVSAIEAGSASTATAGQIIEFETPLLGVTVTNASALVGTDDEDDAALKTRCRQKPASLSPNGPADAYEYVARSALRSDGTPIGVTRVRTTPGSTGTVAVRVATASGPVTGTEGDPSTDLGAIAAAIFAQVEPQAVQASVSSAVAKSIDIYYSLWVYDNVGLTDQELSDLITARLAQFMAIQPIRGNLIDGFPDGKVFADDILTVINGTRDEIFHVELAAPLTSDVTIGDTEVPVLGTVSPIAIFREATVR